MTAAERIAEWDARQRFRPYRLTPTCQDWIAAAGCPLVEGVGVMLTVLKADGEYSDRDAVGVLDTEPWQDGEPGTWLINPHADRRAS